LAGNDVEKLVLDSTYLLPAFGVNIDVETSEAIVETIDLLKARGIGIFVSDLSPLECYLKAFSLAERAGTEEGRKAAVTGLLAVTGDSSKFVAVPYSDERVVREASEIKKSHKDPFDCFIFATAKALNAVLVTEDDSASKYVGGSNVQSWKRLGKLLLR
jgi:predicted nucleic acid-binding protein